MDVAQRLAALDDAVALGDGRLPAEALTAARAVADKARQRLAHGDAAVVVALAGGTGSGKSRLFNALAGRDLAAVGARRPLTSDVTAWAVGDPEPAGRLLDWLGVTQRHHDPDGQPQGLVLLDLPDHDSVALDHRQTSDRFVARVDVLVWVVDPLKYAQRALHDEYLARLAAHAKVTVVVLNRADELAPSEVETVLADLRRLLAAEGLSGARVLATSAVTGRGVDELRALLGEEVRRRTAVAERVSADVRTVAAALGADVPTRDAARLEAAPLVDALAGAAGVDALAATEASAHRADARAATRPLLSRAVWALLRVVAVGPLRWLRPREWRRPAGSGTPRPALGSVPPAVRRALLDLERTAGVRHVVAQEPLVHATGRALDRAVPPARRPPWWALVAVVWTLVELAAAAGAVWLLVLGALAWLQLPTPAPPDVAGELPWPTALLLGGGLAWLTVGAVRNRLVALAGRRRQRRVARALRAAVARVAERDAVAPLREEVAARARLAAALERASR